MRSDQANWNGKEWICNVVDGMAQLEGKAELSSSSLAITKQCFDFQVIKGSESTMVSFALVVFLFWNSSTEETKVPTVVQYTDNSTTVLPTYCTLSDDVSDYCPKWLWPWLLTWLGKLPTTIIRSIWFWGLRFGLSAW